MFLNETNERNWNLVNSPTAKKKLSFSFHFCITQYVVLKRQNIPQDATWEEVQYAKNKLFFSCTFGCQNEQSSEALIFEISKKKWSFSYTTNSCFSYFIFCFQNSQNSVPLIFDTTKKITFFEISKISASKFCSFWQPKVQLKNNLFFVYCTSFHVASCGIFCLFKTTY
jgi:hypothetical protein